MSNQEVSDHDAKNYAMLLDSGLLDSGHDETKKKNLKSSQKFNNANYDIFCCSPCLTLTKQDASNCTSDGKLEIDKLSASLSQIKINLEEQDPLKQMRDILEQIKQNSFEVIKSDSNKIQDADLPFNGGWLGYFSYDFGKSLELADKRKLINNNIPFCSFGLYRWALISDHRKKTTRLYNFGLCENEWHKIKSFFDADKIGNTESAKGFELNSRFESNINFATYQKAFNKIQENIIAGNCYQINYSHQFSAPFKGCSFDAYKRLTEVNKSPFSAYLNFGEFQILSLSPERFIQVRNKKVLTQPIKGTSPRSSDKNTDLENASNLLSSEKDRSENLMIVDLLRNDLSKTADTDSVKVPELFGLYTFESVHHLISTVTSQLAPEYDMFDILQTCLPGGSITGAPKIAAMKIIDELEDFSRGIYCGVIGYMDFKGNMDTNISIRTLLAKDNELTCCAGGGIVFDSTVKSEYQETYHKVSKIIPTLEDTFLNYSPDKNSIKEHG
ncbi:MAG: aminodeoxychorismate synthase, component I [Kangiella sp.]|nr:MAG: aminodeoxychorismate synthase, component I [Kangiella sp.]